MEPLRRKDLREWIVQNQVQVLGSRNQVERQSVKRTTQAKSKSFRTQLDPSMRKEKVKKGKTRKDDPPDSQWKTEVQTGKARVLTRNRLPQGSKTSASPSWLEGGVCLNKDILRDEQLKDPASVDALCWVKNGKKPEKEAILSLGLDHKFLWGNFDCLIIQDGLLCKKVGPLIDGSSRTTVYVPPVLRRELLKQCHDTKTSGHFYFWKTLNKVKRYFCWGGLSKNVQVYCQACHICATRKTAGRHRKARMGHYDVGFPMEEISIDLMGPYPESENGNKYVLVVVDSFSKWMEAYAVPNIEAKTIAEKLVLEFISRFGVPYQIKSDRGRQFDCELFASMCEMLKLNTRCQHHFTHKEIQELKGWLKL